MHYVLTEYFSAFKLMSKKKKIIIKNLIKNKCIYYCNGKAEISTVFTNLLCHMMLHKSF